METPELNEEAMNTATADALEMYREYCQTELTEGRDIPVFSDFVAMMNE